MASVRREGNRRVGWMATVLILLLIVALDVPGRLLTQWTYAVEGGRQQADGEDLAALREQLASVEEVSRAFRLVAKLARPGVVHIRVRGTAPGAADSRFWSELRRQLEERLGEEFDEERWQEFLRQHRESPASGSGIVLDSDGHIVTNNHVIDGRQEIRVQLPDEREYEALLIGSDPQTDLAVIKIDAPDLHPLTFGDSDRMQVGDWVIAVGAPFGLLQSVTHGIISATGREEIPALVGRGIIYQNFLQTDAAINPGNSGGPLLNLRGEVIGINTAIATNSDGYNAGIAFTIPANMALKVVRQLKRSGEVARGWLGITMHEMTRGARQILGIAGRRGVLVNGIIEHSPAAAAPLVVEDVILSVNGIPVDTMAELRGAIADVPPGQGARLDVLRGGERTSVTVVLGRRSTDGRLIAPGTREVRARAIENLELYARTLLPEFAANYGYSERDRGVVVFGPVGDETDSPPIRASELIVGCNGKPVASIAELARAFNESDERGIVLFEVVSPNGERRTVEYKRR